MLPKSGALLFLLLLPLGRCNLNEFSLTSGTSSTNSLLQPAQADAQREPLGSLETGGSVADKGHGNPAPAQGWHSWAVTYGHHLGWLMTWT